MNHEIGIRFGTCKVRRLKAAADCLRRERKLQAAYITYDIRNLSKSKRSLHHRDHIDGDMTKKMVISDTFCYTTFTYIIIRQNKDKGNNGEEAKKKQ